MTQIAVVVEACLFEIWAFDDKLVSRDQKMVLNWWYGPYFAISALMVLDHTLRIHKRVKIAEKVKSR
jgi:hypothetical protein